MLHSDDQLGVTARTGVVAVASGDGIAGLLASAGARVVPGGQSMNPSTAELLDAIRACAADGVVVLPGNGNIVPVARQAAALAGGHVSVVPTRSLVESLAAVVAYSADAAVEDNVAAMEEAAARVHAGGVTRAVRNANTAWGRVAADDWIALTDDGVCASEADALATAIVLVDLLVARGAELVTVLIGADASGEDGAAISAHVERAHPGVEIEVHEGGQPLYPFLIGVE